jgi:hypothetical protein
MRLHPEPGSKWYLKGPHWRFCVDESCLLEHVMWDPFRPIVANLAAPLEPVLSETP